MYRIEATSWINADLQTSWDFFSDPRNLLKLTPSEMKMRVKTDLPEKMYPGMIISYSVAPLFGISLPWTSRINQVKELEYFTDDMIEGPFSIWHHQHFFEEKDGGTEIRDIVDYKVPLGPIGQLFHPLLVKSRVRAIFEHRETAIKEIF